MILHIYDTPSCQVINCQSAWAEDKALQRCNPSAAPGPRPKVGRHDAARLVFGGRPWDVSFLILRDWLLAQNLGQDSLGTMLRSRRWAITGSSPQTSIRDRSIWNVPQKLRAKNATTQGDVDRFARIVNRAKNGVILRSLIPQSCLRKGQPSLALNESFRCQGIAFAAP